MEEKGYLSNCTKCGHDRMNYSVIYCDGKAYPIPVAGPIGSCEYTVCPFGPDEHLHASCICGYSWREECKDKKN